MDTGQEILQLLQAQEEYYLRMKQAVEKQTGHIHAWDIGGLTAGTSEVRGVMRKIRDLEARLRPLRQSWSALRGDRSLRIQREIDQKVVALRLRIEEIQAVRDRNTTLLKQSMGQVRQQMSGLNSRSQAARAYHGKPPSAARFVDKSN